MDCVYSKRWRAPRRTDVASTRYATMLISSEFAEEGDCAMLQNSGSSQQSLGSLRRYFCGRVAKSMQAGTSKNYGRRFYKCPCFGAECTFWEWRDADFPVQAKTVIKELKTSLDVATEERDNLRKIVDEIEIMNSAEMMKMSKMEKKKQWLKLMLIVSWAVFLGYVMARMTG